MAGTGGVQHPFHGGVMHPQIGSDPIQRAAVPMGGEDRRNNLHGLAGRLGGHQLSVEMRGRGACVSGRSLSRVGGCGGLWGGLHSPCTADSVQAIGDLSNAYRPINVQEFVLASRIAASVNS